MTCSAFGTPCGSNNECCPDLFGCSCGCADLCVKRYDTLPSFRVMVQDCDGPINLSGKAIEVNMWAKGKLKTNMLATDASFALADNIGFYQILVGDIIIAERVRAPEHMLVTGFDEINKLVFVQRGYDNTTPQPWNKGTHMKIMRIINGVGYYELRGDEDEHNWNDDGVHLEEHHHHRHRKLESGQLPYIPPAGQHIIIGRQDDDDFTESFLVYHWGLQDLATPGCYFLEFKVLTMNGCEVVQAQRFPTEKEGFMVKVSDSPSAEVSVCVESGATWFVE